MKIETLPQEDHQVKIIAEFEDSTFQQFQKRAARKIAKDHKIPGFRPGKAPFHIIVNQFGEEHIQQHAIEMLIDDMYPKILDEAKINPSGPGAIEEILEVNPPKLSFIVPLVPEVELYDYKSIRKKYKPKSVKKDELDEMIRNLQLNFAAAEPVEREIKEGDLVAIKVVGKINAEEDEEIKNVYDTSTQVIVGDNSYGPDNWPFEGFTKELIGAKEQEEKIITHTFPDDAEVEQVRGKTVEFVVNIEGVKEINYPDLDDEFAKTVGEYETFKELKENIKDNLTQQKKQEYDEEYLSGIIDTIVKNSTIKYPPNILQNQIEQVIQSVEQDLARQNLDLETYLKTMNKDRETYTKEDIEPIAVQRLERGLVLEEIGKKENIKIENEELQPAVTQSLMQFQQTPGFEKFNNQKSMNNLTNAIAMETYNRLYSQHILEQIKKIASGELDKEQEKETALETDNDNDSPVDENSTKSRKKPKKSPADSNKVDEVETDGVETEKQTKKTSKKKKAE